MVFDASLLGALFYPQILNEKEALGSPSTAVEKILYFESIHGPCSICNF